jgi:hypothetical protein
MAYLPTLAVATLASLAVVFGAAATEVETDDDTVVVTAPETDVDVSSDKVTVETPYTDVEVDEKARTVRIRVPYFSGDISW